MKKVILSLLTAVMMFCFSTTASAQTKVEMRYAYTLKHLKLDKATEAKFGPILQAYLKERKEAGDIYDDVKKKYKAAEKAGTLTDSQATQLMSAKMDSQGKELIVKRKYLAEFKKVLSPKKVYYAFDYAGDNYEKIELDMKRK